jgi:hypothetical protein
MTHNNIISNVVNTCSFDNQLQILYVLYKVHGATKEYLNNMVAVQDPVAKQIVKIFRAIDICDFNEAKRRWIVNVVGKSPSAYGVTDMYDSEEEFVRHTKHFVRMLEIRICNNKKCRNENANKEVTVYPSADWVVRTPALFTMYCNVIRHGGRCEYCNTKGLEIALKMPDDGPPHFMLFVIPNVGSKATSDKDVPKEYKVLGYKYYVVAYTMFNSDHFYSPL